MTGPFDSLLDLHHEFAEDLLLHQEALVRGDLAAARAGIEALAAKIEAHIVHEETKILPVVERAGGWSRIGDPRFYREEHEKIRSTLAALVAKTAGLAPGAHRAIALLVGEEHAFRALLEHHDDRERRALYPDLQRVTRPDEWAGLLEPPVQAEASE